MTVLSKLVRILSPELFQWRTIKCKHNARWLQVSPLKLAQIILKKTYNVNKRHQLKTGKVQASASKASSLIDVIKEKNCRLKK